MFEFLVLQTTFAYESSMGFEFKKQARGTICVKQHPLKQVQTNQDKQLQANQRSKQQKAKRTRQDQREAVLRSLWSWRSWRVSATPSSICLQEIISFFAIGMRVEILLWDWEK